jgi:tetratricopeptide (TPR) repeat protein
MRPTPNISCLVFVLLFFSSSFSQAQSSKLDSLLKILSGISEGHNTLPDTQRIGLLLQIGNLHKDMGNHSQAMNFANQSKALTEHLIKQKFPDQKAIRKYYTNTLFLLGLIYSEKADFLNGWSYLSKVLKMRQDNSDQEEIAATYNAIGSLNRRTGNNQNAIKYYKKAYAIAAAMNDKAAMAAYSMNLGSSFLNSGDAAKAIEHLYVSIKLNEELKDKPELAAGLMTLGTTYYESGNHPKALENYFKALKIREELGVKSDIAAVLNNIGNIYLFQPDYKKARTYYSKALGINNSDHYIPGAILCHINIGVTYLAEKNYDAALENLLKSLKLQEESGDINGVVESCINVGIAYYQQASENKQRKTELLAQSKLYLDRGFERALKNGSKPIIRECYMALSEFYEVSGQQDQALSYYKKYIALRDSLKNEENTASMLRSELNYEFEKKENAAREAQEKKDLVAKTEQEKQKVIRNSFIAAFVFMLVLAVLIYREYRNKRKTNFTILRQKKEVEHQKHLVEQKQKQIIDSINYAQRIQSSILVSEAEIKKSIPECFVLYLPKDIVSGDFYWFHNMGSESTEKSGQAAGHPELVFAVGDCTGHGVPGGFLSMVGSTLLNEIVSYKKITDPARIIKQLSKGVSSTLAHKERDDHHTDGMDISICKIDMDKKKIYFAAANHSMYHVNATGLCQVDAQISSISGIFGLNEAEQFHTIELSPAEGTMVYLATDGYSDQIGGERGKKFLASRLEDLLKEIHQFPVHEQKQKLEENFLNWKGHHKQIDDILIVGFRI